MRFSVLAFIAAVTATATAENIQTVWPQGDAVKFCNDVFAPICSTVVPKKYTAVAECSNTNNPLAADVFCGPKEKMNSPPYLDYTDEVIKLARKSVKISDKPPSDEWLKRYFNVPAKSQKKFCSGWHDSCYQACGKYDDDNTDQQVIDTCAISQGLASAYCYCYSGDATKWDLTAGFTEQVGKARGGKIIGPASVCK